METTESQSDIATKTSKAKSEMVRTFDPVCGMDVDPPDPSVQQIDRQGTTYHFCSIACRREFESTPEEFERNRW